MKTTPFMLILVNSMLFFSPIAFTEDLDNDQKLFSNISDGAEELSSTDVSSILRLDVFSFFNLNDEYDTQLKRKIFRDSPEYKEKLKELTKKRDEIKNGLKVFLTLEGSTLGEFLLKKKHFQMVLSENCDMGTEGAQPPKCIKDFCFPRLPIKEVNPQELILPGCKERVLPIATGEKVAEIIENDMENIKIHFLFKPIKVQKMSFPFYEAGSMNWLKVSSFLPIADKTKVVIVRNDEILWMKDY